MGYFRASEIGTHVKLPDGRVGTTVYNGLDGIGIKWGIHHPSLEDFEGTSGGCVDIPADCPAASDDWPWKPDAMLRDPYPGSGDAECVGEEYELITAPENE